MVISLNIFYILCSTNSLEVLLTWKWKQKHFLIYVHEEYKNITMWKHVVVSWNNRCRLYASHVLYHKIIKSSFDLKQKVITEFPNAWEDSKNNLFIPSTIVLCDFLFTKHFTHGGQQQICCVNCVHCYKRQLGQ